MSLGTSCGGSTRDVLLNRTQVRFDFSSVNIVSQGPMWRKIKLFYLHGDWVTAETTATERAAPLVEYFIDLTSNRKYGSNKEIFFHDSEPVRFAGNLWLGLAMCRGLLLQKIQDDTYTFPTQFHDVWTRCSVDPTSHLRSQIRPREASSHCFLDR